MYLGYARIQNHIPAAKSLQSCPTLCDPIDCSLPGSPVPGILQARTLEWVATAFSNAWKWRCSVVSDSLWPHGLQPTRLLCPWDLPGNSTGVGCHCCLRKLFYCSLINYLYRQQTLNFNAPIFQVTMGKNWYFWWASFFSVCGGIILNSIVL